ncbi:putative formate transporter 1 [subsurface metagenome]
MFKTPVEIAKAAVASGKAKTEMGWGRLLVLGFLAGAYIAFGSQLAVTAAAGAPWPQQLPGLQKLIFGAVFPVGLMLVVIAGSELFTGNCMLPTIACLEKQGRWLGLAKNWLGSYIGNFAGSVFVAYFLAVATGLFLVEPWCGYAT